MYIDRSGNLYVGDYSNNRVLIFKDIVSKVNNNTLTNGLDADFVLGQNNFYTNGNGTFDASDTVTKFGLNGDTFVIGDWNGAGVAEIGVVRTTAKGLLQWSLDTNLDGSADASARPASRRDPGATAAG